MTNVLTPAFWAEATNLFPFQLQRNCLLAELIWQRRLISSILSLGWGRLFPSITSCWARWVEDAKNHRRFVYFDKNVWYTQLIGRFGKGLTNSWICGCVKSGLDTGDGSIREESGWKPCVGGWHGRVLQFSSLIIFGFEFDRKSDDIRRAAWDRLHPQQPSSGDRLYLCPYLPRQLVRWPSPFDST